MKKPLTLIVVSNSHEAKIFEKIGKLEFELNLLCEISADLDSNHEKPGRSFNSTGSTRHGIEPHTDRREVEKHKFAEKVAAELHEIEKQRNCDNLILLGSHKMLEELEKTINNGLSKKITHKLAKDLSEYNVKELKDYIQKNLTF